MFNVFFVFLIQTPNRYEVFSYDNLSVFCNRAVDINEGGEHGWTPLHSAIISDYCGAEGLQRLIDKGADVNVYVGGTTPLSWALNHKVNDKFLTLMNAGADIDKEVDYAGGMGDGPCSILDVALYSGNNYIARLLIEKGADLDSRTSYGYSRLHWCAMGGNRSMAYFFMKKGFDPNEKGKNGSTPLSVAKRHPEQNAAVIEVLESGYLSKAEADFYALVETEEYQDLDIVSYKGQNFKTKNIKGGSFSLDGYKGKILFLNIWGTWCPPCVREMPSMQKLYEHMEGKDFAMLASSYEDDFDRIKRFIDDRGFTFDVAHDEDQSLVEAYPSVMPTSYIIDKKGNVLAKVDGSMDWSEEKYLKLFDFLVKM
ncbi:MAG: redoxin domain-containing protein [Aureispira sp.]|nr:redoxin domain-containing protein [Aureispira sp.]